MRKGLTMIEVVVAVVAIALLAGVVLVGMCGFLVRQPKRSPSMVKDGVNLRNIHAGMAVYAASNKDWFPGLTSAGDYIGKPFQGEYYGAMPNASSAAEETNGDGCTLAVGSNLALAITLEEGLIMPAQLVSHGETDATSTTSSAGIAMVVPDSISGAKVVPAGVGIAPVGEVRSNHCSIAMLAYGKPAMKEEWKSNQNQAACVLATRLIFNGKVGEFNSVWTDTGSGSWKGWVVRGDSSTSSEPFKSGDLAKGGGLFDKLQYGSVLLDARTESNSVIGIFGRSTDMKNFDATPTTGMLGSVND